MIRRLDRASSKHSTTTCLSLPVFTMKAILLLALIATSLMGSSVAASPISPAPKGIPPGYSSEIIQVKFREGTDVHLPEAVLSAESRSSVMSINRLFSLPEEKLDEVRAEGMRARGENRSVQPLPDLNKWFKITLKPRTDAAAFIEALKRLDSVETVEPAPLPAPPPATTPVFTGSQGYLGAVPGGIDAHYSWTIPGGNGTGVKVYDVEYSWNQNHEDLSKAHGISLLLSSGDSAVDPFGDNNHGTAVLGELIADNDAKGVTGIAWGAEVGLAPANTMNLGYNPANAIALAMADGSAGDVILIEQQTTVCGLPQGSYGPLEWDTPVFDAIQTATANGFVVVEAAGNGNVNLDQATCNDRFNRNVRDSGAVIVGAGQPPSSGSDRQPESFSSYGSRVDVQGWGSRVTTTGYGVLYTNVDDSANRNFWYTDAFNGTSSASPIVAGAAADLQGVVLNRFHSALSPFRIRTLLLQTGSPQLGNTAEHIGPRPNLRDGIAQISAIRPGFDTRTYGPNDDGTYPCTSQSAGTPAGCTPTSVPLGFTINFFGNTFNSLYINNNGNLTFDFPLSTFTPFDLNSTSRIIIAPLFADVDTRVGNVVTFGPGTVGGRSAFGVTWPGVGCYSQITSVLDYFQVVLVDRSDIGPGDFDIEFNYHKIQWETGQASGGNSACQRGFSARVGYSNGSGTSFELPGSAVNGAFLDTNLATGLVQNSRNSFQSGRYVFPVRNGVAPTGGTISGRVFANNTANPLSDAFVQVCGSSGACNSTRTNASGQYSVSGLAAGQYNVTAFPPGSTTLRPGTIGPLTLPSNGSLINQDIILTGPTPPPTGTTITSRSTGGGGIPVVYWREDLTLSTQGCSGGTASYEILQDSTVIRSGGMAENPAGTYTAIVPQLYPLHGYARVVITILCPDSTTTSIPFDIYIDPSGVVRTVTGVPVAGAVVTLFRSDSSSGPFEVVPNGSGIMSLANRNNPDTTDAAGRFGWDVVAGFYKVRAEKAGCVSPTDPSQIFVESAVLTVPPAVTDLDLRLSCPALAIAELSFTKTANTGTYSQMGDVIIYTYVTTNTGNVTLQGPFMISDDKLGTFQCSTATSLVPGASVTCTSTHTINQSDLDAGSVTNTATASGAFGGLPVTSNQAQATVTAIQSPALSLTKSANPTIFSYPGQVIVYTFVTANTGNVTLSGPVTIGDDKLGTFQCGTATSLAPGASVTCTKNYTIQPADLSDLSVVTNPTLPADATISSAKFEIYSYAVTNQTVRLHRITAPWLEPLVTWNNFGGFDPTVIGSFTTDVAGWRAVDVTALVKAWADGTYRNYGLLLEQGATDYNTYTSSEWTTKATLRPKLTICYTSPTRGNACVTIQRSKATPTAVPDAYIWQAQPDLNAGSAINLFTGLLNGGEKQSLLRFDVNGSITNHATATGQFGANTVTSNPAQATINQVPPTAKITSTSATCSAFANGTAKDLTNLLYTISADGKRIKGVAPTAFFYYSTLQAPASNFTIQIGQTNDNGWKHLPPKTMGEVVLYDAACTTSAAQGTTTYDPTTGATTINMSGATPGAIYYIAIKYNAGSLVGTTISQPYPTANYTIVTYINDNAILSSWDSMSVKPK